MANSQHRILSTEVIGTFTENGYGTPRTYEERIVVELAYRKGRGYEAQATLQAHDGQVMTTRYPSDFAHARVLPATPGMRFNAKTLATTTPDPAVLAALRAKLLPESRAIVQRQCPECGATPTIHGAAIVCRPCDVELAMQDNKLVVIGGGLTKDGAA